MAAGLKVSKEVASITSLSRKKHLKIGEVYFFPPDSDFFKISVLFFNCHHIITLDGVKFTIRLYTCNKKNIYDVIVLLIVRRWISLNS